MGNPYEPKTAFYTPQTFSKEAKLAEMYGSQASRRDKRKFEKYWNSEQRYNDEDAFNKAETDKMFASADARFKEINDAYKARSMAQQVAPAVTPQEIPVPTPVPAPTTTPAPVLRPKKPNADWDAIAAEKSGGKYKTMQDVVALQRLMQSKGIDIGKYGPDGKWGEDTDAAYKNYIAQQKIMEKDRLASVMTQRGMVWDEEKQLWTKPKNQDQSVFTNQEQQTTEPVNTTKSNTPTPLQGKNSYYTEAMMQTDFDRLYSESLGNPYMKQGSGNYAYVPTIDTELLRNSEGYNDAWESFKTSYTDNGNLLDRGLLGWAFGNRYVKHKKGGIMNRINYFQQGGAAPQQDIQKQVVALVQAAMQGDQKATQTVNQIMEAAKAGDQQATQLAQMIQQVVQQMQGQATAAKWGAKLGYIKSLKYAKGGKTCPACEQKVEMKKCGGKKAKKRYFGGYL